ncbi:MAG: MucR family transcriptional regulator [Litorimonas sp.]
MGNEHKSDNEEAHLEADVKLLLKHTSEIVSAYVKAKDVELSEMSNIIQTIYQGLSQTAFPADIEGEEQLEPAVSIAESLRDDVIICLEDGLPFQSLKRHLRVKYNMTPEAYRKKWGLPADYPMVAPDYAKRRSALAKRSGLGKSR